MKYRVVLEQIASTVIDVEADDIDAAIDEAWQEAPSGLCAQCSGWNNPPGVNLAGEWEASVVYDEHDHEVWNERGECDD